ncbi:MAG TPA: hypothetical protein VJT31_05120, partial [Rugosimonospora sp.]|nr:hypothetical protein [Rugosimonospora sp.]
MAGQRYSPGGWQDPGRHTPPSLYDSSSAQRLQAAPPPDARRRLRKPVGIAAALAAIAAGAVTYIAIGHAAAAPNPNCTLIVPANPLSAAGLATPYQLVATNANNGPCNEANANQSAFVQGAIIDANGAITLYNPLVIDQGTQAAATPAAATVPAGSTVGLWFGFNGTNLTLKSAKGKGNALFQGRCVNGLRGSIFGQFAYCNAPAFFAAANKAIAAGQLAVPAVGTAKDGKPCPTVRDFSLVDQDQSDNVVTHYLANANGQTAQPNAAGKAAVGANAVDLANGSDNRLLDVFVDPTLGCTPFTAPEQSADNTPSSSLPLNELQAAAGQQAPIALVPLTDPMTLVNANQSTRKTNLFRVGVDQTPIGAANNGSGATYCQNLFTNPAGIQRVFNAQAILANGTTPDAATGTNLFTFLAARANASFTNLNCANFNVANPITLTLDGNGVATAATFTAGGAAAAGGASAAPSASAPAAPAAAS